MATKRAKIIEPRDMQKIFKAIESESKHPLRDKVTVLLSAKAGLRAAEIAGLKWSDVTKADGSVDTTIHVNSEIAKGGRERMVPVNNELHRMLIKLRQQRPADDVIRFGDYKPTMTANAMTVWFKRMFAKVDLIGCSSHSGRRTFITVLARNANLHGGSLRDVQLLAGHANLGTTERYIEPSEAVRAMVNDV